MAVSRLLFNPSATRPVGLVRLNTWSVRRLATTTGAGPSLPGQDPQPFNPLPVGGAFQPDAPLDAIATPAAPPVRPPAVPLSPLELTRRLQSLMPEFSRIGSRRRPGGLAQPDRNPPAPNELSMAELLAAGLHLGHSKSRWNPFTLPFIYGQRSGTYIINLEHTVAYLRRALNATREVARAGGIILFIATRPNMVYPVGEAATACGQYHVNGKWLPGTLTNSEVVLGRYAVEVSNEAGIISTSSSLTAQTAPATEAQTRDVVTERTNGRTTTETTREEAVSQPPATRNHVFKPDLMVFFNMLENKPALAEARASNIPTIGVVDTDCNPHCVTYPIPANDDSVTGIKLLAALFSKAAQEGAYLRQKAYYQQQQEQAQREEQVINENAADDSLSF